MRRLLPLALLAASCNTGFDPQYRVEDLRILAVRSQVEGSSSADAAPGDTIRLEALVANPLGRDPLTVRWFTCAPPAPNEIAACLDPDLLRDTEVLAAQPGVIELSPGPSTSVLVPDVPEVAEALAAAVDLATRNPTYRCKLYVDLPVVALAEAGGRRDAAVKRVRLVPPPGSLPPELADGYVLNLNPAIGEIVRDPDDADLCTGGTPLFPDPFPAGRRVLCGRAASGAVGPYNECGPRGELTPVEEFLFWQWYVTAGELPEFDGIGNAVGDSVDFERPPGPFALWVILRDGRGGVAWQRVDVP